jgi:2-polyprenyl-3-methyl-5-hydroxy-6-metoxy-1,4-benzoquinol methylase
MKHPYAALPDTQFWSRSVEKVERHLLDPCGPAKFIIQPDHKIISAGSCFAQVVAKVLQSNGFNYLVSEAAPDLPLAEQARRNYGVYSARYGNLFTPKQLRQLLHEAFDGAVPVERFWRKSDGTFLDPYRPLIEPDGFATAEQMAESRDVMLEAVRTMVREADVFVYTLGITECWRSAADGWVFPFVPGACGGTFDKERHEFINFGFVEALDDVRMALEIIKQHNPNLKVLLSLSPVQMIATYENEHVLTASTYGKSVLRAVAGEISAQYDWVQYFPSYELMTGSFSAGVYYNDDTRTINDAGVAHVVRSLFANMVAGGDLKKPKRTVAVRHGDATAICDDDVMAGIIARSALNARMSGNCSSSPPRSAGDKMPVTKEDVIWGYKMFLGREPESEEVIASHMGIANVGAFRDALMSCEEFTSKLPKASAQIAAVRHEMMQRVPLYAPMNSVDYEPSPEQMGKLWKRIKHAWEALGRAGAHHSVLTNADYLPEKFAQNEAGFWNSGVEEAEWVSALIAKYTDRELAELTCTEYGCGVGRLSVPFSKQFKAYHALDISQPHLDLAQERAQLFGQAEIQFENVTDLASRPLPDCDIFYSRIVLQHNPPPIMVQILTRAMQALAPDGIAIFQLPVYQRDYVFSIVDYLDKAQPTDMEMHCLPQHKVFELLDEAGCAVLEVREDNAVEAPHIFVSMTFVVRKGTGAQA